MKIVTGIAVITTAEGKRITYTYSEIDAYTGAVTQSNVKRSFIVLDAETLGIVSQLEVKVNGNLGIS